MSNPKIVYAGWDPGNSQSTLALRVKNRIVCFTITSLVGGGNLEQLTTIRKGAAGGSGALEGDELALEMGGATYFGGELAHESRTANAQRNTLARYSNGHGQRLLALLIGKLFSEHVILRLVTGLPIKFMGDGAKG